MSNNPKERLAANVRRLRIAHHLSQSELARVTSMSKATLSGIEKGRGNPTVDTLASLAQALGVPVAGLLEEAQMGEVRIARASQTDPIEPNALGNRQLEASTGAHRAIEVYELTLPPGHVHRRPAREPGSREGALVLDGKLIAGPVDRISELDTGDYVSFPTDVAHVYETGRAAARVLVLTYAPT